MAEEVYKSPEVFKNPIKLPKVESSEKGALSTTATQEDPVYRKKVYNFLKRELSDFKLSEDDFYKKLDTDQAYAPKVYSFLKNNFSDFSKPEQDFLFLMTPSKKKDEIPTISISPGEKLPDASQTGAGTSPSTSPSQSQLTPKSSVTAGTSESIPASQAVADFGNNQPGFQKLVLDDGFEFDTRDPIGAFYNRAFSERDRIARERRLLSEDKALKGGLMPEYRYALDKGMAAPLPKPKTKEEIDALEEQRVKDPNQAGRENDYKSVVALYETNPDIAVGHLSKVLGIAPVNLLSLSKTQIDGLQQKMYDDAMTSAKMREGMIGPQEDISPDQGLPTTTDLTALETLRKIVAAKKLLDNDKWLIITDKSYQQGMPANWFVDRSVEKAAIAYAAETDPNLAKMIAPLMRQTTLTSADGKSRQTSLYPDPSVYKDAPGLMGQIVYNFLFNPLNEAVAKTSPVAAQFQQARDNFVQNYPKFAAAAVGNKVSQAYEKSGQRGWLSRIAQMDTPGLRSELDETAKQTLSPEEYNIYVKYVRGNEEFLDVPSVLEDLSKGITGVFSGIGNTFTEPFTPTSETQLKNWEQQVTNVSANPVGFWKFTNNAAHMVGFVMGMAAGGDLIKGAQGLVQGAAGTTAALSPTAINMTNAGLVFFGDNLETGKMKYPDDPVKAYASAGFNTALFMALAKDLFPVKQVQSAIRTVAPEVDVVVGQLSTGAITRQAAKSKMQKIYTNAFQTLKNATGQNIKVSAEMAGIAAADRGFDAVMGLDKEKYNEYHPANSEIQAFTNMFMGNAGVAAWAGYGKMRYKNRAPIEAYYSVAQKPDFFRKMVEVGEGTPESKKEILENINFIETLKKELDGLGMSESRQKVYIANALGEKAVLARKSADPTLQKKNEQEAGEIRADQEALLQNPGEEIKLTDEGFVPAREEEKPEIKIESEKIVEEEVARPPAEEAAVVKINDVIGRTGTYKGQKGRLYLDGRTVVFDVEGSNREYVIGDIEAIGEQGVGELGIEAEGKVVSTNENGNLVIRGEELINQFSDPAQAINRNKEGEVVSVNLETADGKKRTFRGDTAKDIAAEIEQGRVAGAKIPEGEVPVQKVSEEKVPAGVAEGAPPVRPSEAPVEIASQAPQPKQKTIEEQAAEQQAETERLMAGEAENNRRAGRFVRDGVEYVRNEQGQGEYSDRKGEVRFTNEVSVPFRYKIVEAETLQPSHMGGVRNPNHFVPEAQPKSRLDKGSIMAEEGFANNPRFDELGENPYAFSGAPVVNQRNEVVQGNNRAAGLKKGYERNNPAYKEALKANATKFGFSPSQVEGMKNPVLVREVAVNDAGAIELGNYDVKDLETGGKRRLDPIAVTRRMPMDAKKRLAELLFGGEGTVNQSLRNNFDRVMEILKPLLNQAQRNTIINKEGNLTEAGAKDIEAVGQQLLFDNGDPALPDLFENLSQTQKEGIRKSLQHIFAGGSDKNLVREVQNAILGLNDFAASGAKDLKQWMSQTDLLRDGKTPRDIYTPLELKMIEILNEAKSQAAIKEKFSAFENAIADKEANMFEPAQKGKSKEEAVKEIFQPEEAPKEEPKVKPEVAPEAKPEVPAEYLKNVRQGESEGIYNADFGRNGGITWEVPESQREKDSPEYLIVQSIDRNKNTGEAPKEDSKGEGAKAIADLFNKYPSVNEIVYDDYSETGFWQKIGGDNQSLKRQDFFKYYNSKFPPEAKPEVPQPELTSEKDGEKLSEFSEGDIVYRNYDGKYEEYEIVNDEKDIWELRNTETGAISKWNAQNNGGFIKVEEVPAEELARQNAEEAARQKFYDEYDRSGYRYGQYGGNSKDILYIKDEGGKVVKEIKIKSTKEGKEITYKSKDYQAAQNEVYKWIDSKAGTKIFESHEELIRIASEAPQEAPKELKEGDRVTLKLSTGGEVTGEKVTVPGYENMDFVAVKNKDGMNYDIYELASGKAIGADVGTFFSAKEAADRVGEYLASNKVTREKLFENFIKKESDPTAGRFIINESPAFENYKSQKQAEAEKRPFVHNESERKRLIEIADEARKKGLNWVADGILAAANSRQGKFESKKITQDVARQRIADAEKKKSLQELQDQQKPLPEEDRKQRKDTPEEFKEVINSDYERDQYKKLPQSIKSAAYDAFKKQIAIFNKYGYYPKYLVDAASDIQIATLKYIRAGAARKVETRPERIKKAEEELIETINFINQKHYEEFGGEKPAKVETIGARGGAEVGGEPKGEVPTTEGGKGKYTKKAEEIAKKIMDSELPSWLKGAKLPPGTEKMGPSLPSEQAIKKALANAVIKMGKLLDKGVEFSQAVKEATRDLVKLMGKDKAEDIQNNFTDYYNQKNAIPKQKAGRVSVQPEAGAGEKMEGGVPGAEPQKPSGQKTEGEGKGAKEITIERPKAFLNAIISAKGTPKAAKEGLERQGLSYKTKSQREAAELAQSIIESQGVEAAVEAAEKELLDGDVNALLMMKSLERLSELEASATSPEEKQKYAIRFAEIANTFDNKARSKGRFNSAIAYFYKKSPLGIVINENNRRKQRFDEWAENKERNWRDFYDNLDELLKDPEVANIIKEKIAEGIAEKTKEGVGAKAGDSLRKFAAAIRKGRISKLGGFRAGTGFDAVWDASVEVVAKAVEGGATLADAIEAGLEYVRGTNWYANLTNKSEFEDKYKKHFESEYAKSKKNSKAAERFLESLKKKLPGLSAKQRDEVVKKYLKKIVESGGLDYQEFRDIIGEVTGRGSLTDAEARKMEELVRKTNAIEDAAKIVQEERTEESLKDYRIAELEAAKAASELQEMLDTNPNIWDRLTSIMQLNTLGIPALVNNPIYNVWNQATIRFPVGVVNTFLDQALAKAYASVGKEYVPEVNVFNRRVQADFFKKLGFGTKEAFTQFLTGLNRQDYIQKELTTSKIRPWESLKSLVKSTPSLRKLAKMFGRTVKEEKLSNTQKIDKALQATVGLPAEIVARTLNLGDKPQRFAAEAGTAAMFAETLGLKDLDYQIFIEFPREEAYAQLRKQGLSEAEANERADYIKESIVREGKRSTFQQDNILNNLINKVFSGETFGGAGNLIKSVAISPYIKIPANAYWSYYNMVNPEVALLQSMVYGARAAKTEGAKSKLAAREARYWFGHAVVGVATRAVVLALVQQGVFNPGTDREETKKEREGKSDFIRQGTVDLDKLSVLLRGGDPDKVTGGVLVPLKYLGHWGTIGNAISKKYEEMTPEQRKAQLRFWDAAIGGMELDAVNELQEGIFSNTSSLLSALQDERSLRRYGMNVVNLFTNIVQPAAAAQIERSALSYQSTVKADNFMDELKNNMLQRSAGLRYLTGSQPPAKIGVWGDQLDRKENFMMRWFGISKENKDNFAYPIWELYKKTGDIGYFPPAVLPRLNDQDLTVEQTNRLQELIGKARKSRVSPVINNQGVIDEFEVKFKDLSDENKKFVLQYLYDLGREDGIYQFLLTYPELDPKNEFKNELDYEMNERRRAFRERMKYEGRSEAQIEKMMEDRFKK